MRIRCDEGYAFTGAGSDTLGIAFPGPRLAYLDPTICRALYDLAFRETGAATSARRTRSSCSPTRRSISAGSAERA